MICCVAAGGAGTRMAPATRWVNKHLLPVGDGMLMIDMPLKFLRLHAIDEVFVVTGANHAAQVVEHVGDGERYGFTKVQYGFQSKPAGIGDIINRIPEVNDGVLLILGDNYFSSIQGSILNIQDYPEVACAFEFDLRDAELAKRFGQANRDANGKIASIVEKPVNPTHAKILTGLYYFPKSVFQIVKSLTPSARNEIEVTDLLDVYLRKGNLSVHEIEGDWADLGEWPSWQKFVSERV
jgi:glucose-1-phosphate thymidylyltransferase